MNGTAVYNDEDAAGDEDAAAIIDGEMDYDNVRREWLISRRW